MTYFRKK